MLEVFGKPFVDFAGSGYIAFSDGSRSAISFRFVQLHNGELFLLAKQREEAGCVPIDCINNSAISISGILDDRRVFETRSTPFLKSAQISFPDSGSSGFLFLLTDVAIGDGENRGTTRFHLTNLIFVGTEKFVAENGSYMLYLPIKILGLKLGIYPVSDYKEQKNIIDATRQSRVTAFVEIPTNDWNIFDAKIMMDNLCWLLSFARGTKINWICATGFNLDNKITISEYRSAITWNYTGLSAIGSQPLESENRLELMNFIESSYELFSNLRKEYSIQETIDTIVFAKIGNGFLEFRGMLLSTAIDGFRARWATKNKREFIFDKADFTKRKSKLEKAVVATFESLVNGDSNKDKRRQLYEKVKELNRRSFFDILKELNKSMSVGLEDSQMDHFKDNRNELVHSGRFSGNRDDDLEAYKNEFWKILAFADRLILGLLGDSRKGLVWTRNLRISDL
ncbi:MAG: hypothetical protein HQK86_07265 [Nitrospinae bacterium]|nr:hypothetical protein [Nitrospinota bacterium]